MNLKFFKMHAQGNDYIYVDLMENEFSDMDFPVIARKLSQRNFSIGADGLVLIMKDASSDAFMRIFNADGSEAEMCGSALRCVSFYLFKKYNKTFLTINSLSGIKHADIIIRKGKTNIKVNLGKPVFIQDKAINICGISGYKINAGNPHFVIFSDELSDEYVLKYGYLIESDQEFPDRTNVDFIKIENRKTIIMKFWERGSGKTLACGTGTIASYFAAHKLELVDDEAEVFVPGGIVKTSYENGNYFLCGEVDYVFQGVVEI